MKLGYAVEVKRVIENSEWPKPGWVELIIIITYKKIVQSYIILLS